MSNYTDFISAQVTLADHTATYNLYTLLTALDSGAGTTTPPICRELTLQSDTGNSGAKIYLGDPKIDTGNPPTRYGTLLLAGGSITDRSVAANISIANQTIRTDTDGAKVNVRLIL